jgi:hypothetical protein
MRLWNRNALSRWAEGPSYSVMTMISILQRKMHWLLVMFMDRWLCEKSLPRLPSRILFSKSINMDFTLDAQFCW